jgi:hypothetical protein
MQHGPGSGDRGLLLEPLRQDILAPTEHREDGPMTGYENSPDYSGPEPSWREAVVILAVIVTVAGAIWALRHLLLHWGLAW